MTATTYKIEKYGQWYELRFEQDEFPHTGLVRRAHTKAPMVILKRALESTPRKISTEDFRRYVEDAAKSTAKQMRIPLGEARLQAAKYVVEDLSGFGIKPPPNIEAEYGRIFAGVQRAEPRVKIKYGGTKVLGGRVVKS